MPIWLGRVIKAVISIGATIGGVLLVDSLVSGDSSNMPAPVVTFDWTGFLTIFAIAGGLAFITWLILKRKK